MGNSGIRKIDGEKERVEKREKEISQPVLMKVGIAIAFSFVGFVFSQIGARTQPHSTLPSLVTEEEEEETSCNLMQEECNFVNEITDSQTENDSTAAHTAKSVTVSSSPTRSSSGDEEGYLLPEFNNLVLEEFGSRMVDPYLELYPNLNQIESSNEIEKEISVLRNLVCSLQEREKYLELQLLEFSNLEAHEISINELKNQLKVKLHTLKLESSENQSLRAQLSENYKTVAELKQAREQVRVLTDRVHLLREEMKVMYNGVEERSKRMEELEEELKDLRLANACLEEENLELIRQLELQKVGLRNDKTFRTSKEAEAIEEAENLRQEVEKLAKEIEQLQSSRCADLEELVYLKWINACLRYELREHQPTHGKTLARDLSITASPNSKEKAKQLIHDYAYNWGPTFSDDFCWEYSSESSGDSSKTSNNKTKLFGKLKCFGMGKDEKKIDRERDSCRFSSWGSASSCMTDELAVPVNLQRPLDQLGKLVRSRSDAGLGYREKEGGFAGNNFHGNGFEGSEVAEKIRLKRLADALDEPEGGWHINRRASFSFH